MRLTSLWDLVEFLVLMDEVQTISEMSNLPWRCPIRGQDVQGVVTLLQLWILRGT